MSEPVATYFHSTWTRTEDREGLAGVVEGWLKERSAEVPGFVGLWWAYDYDDTEIYINGIETTDRSAFFPGPHSAVSDLTDRLHSFTGGPERVAATEDVQAMEAEGLEPSADQRGKGHGALWFSATDPSKVAPIVREWMSRHISQTPCFEVTWHSQGIVDTSIQAVAAQYTTKKDAYVAGARAFDELIEKLGDVVIPGSEWRGRGGTEPPVGSLAVKGASH